MAGHSKWANIKHRKSRQDAVRGKIWSKCSRAIIVAAKNGGSDPTTNLSLRYALEEARSSNMPKDTIEKAIRKGSGEGNEDLKYTEIRYEGYGAGGVAVIVDCLTDNVNRTAPEMRKIFEKGNGKLGKPGAVAYGFNQVGIIHIESTKVAEDSLLEVVLEAGADDVVDIGGAWEVSCAPSSFLALKESLVASGVEPDSAEVTMVPMTTVPCDASTARKILRLVEDLENHDDVQKVYFNAEIDDEILAEQS